MPTPSSVQSRRTAIHQRLFTVAGTAGGSRGTCALFQLMGAHTSLLGIDRWREVFCVYATYG